MLEKKRTELKIKIGELSDREDYGRGIARIDSKKMAELGIREGDVVELEGTRKTPAVAVRAYPADVGRDVARIDGLVRKNAGTSIGDLVTVRRADPKEAKKVTLAPAEKSTVFHISPNLLKQNLYMRPISKGDIIIANPVFRKGGGRRGEDIFEEMFGFGFEEVFFGTEVKLVVVKTNPEGPVQISDMTEVELMPESVEVEEVKVPTVTYEDIGGLKEVVPKIREMIEVPLRHPELFERLGVEPPKGVLLHGPPGCGKTLLARVVANEAGANFISVAGPEVVSKWYGGSLPYDENIVISENGRTKFVKIGELVDSDNYEGKKALAFDEKGKITFAPIKGLILHPNDLKMYEISTRSGRKIKVTESHSLFTLQGTKIVSVKTKELEPGKSYVAVPKKILQAEQIVEKINLLETFAEKDYGLVVRSKELLKAAVEKLGVNRAAKILCVREKYVYDILSKDVGVRISKFMKLAKEAGLELKPGEIEISTKFKSIPAVLELSNELCEFLGLWIAEGSYNYENTNRETFRVSLNEKEVDYYKNLCEKLFGSVTVYRKRGTKGCDIYINNRAFSSVMRALGFEAGAHKKKVPEIIYSLPREKIASFLKGCFSGDGSLYKNQHGVPTIEYSTRSNGLAGDVMYLLLYFGIVAKVYSTKQKDGVSQRVCFTGAQNLSVFKEIGFAELQKNMEIENYIKSVKWTRSQQIPITGEIKNLVAERLPNWSGSATIGSAVVEAAELGDLILVAESDIYWDLVEEIREVECKDKYVYDISVDPCQNFVGGFGGIFAHNSEENLRNIFQEAEKNAPSIVFFDEIDAIAPKREEVTGEVERRMVSQLLSLMDGLKSRGKIIVIAATNRPNALDPALRRGGRFDREIEIPVPDKNGRKEILQIHTRYMPMEKDVDVDKLSEITYGYVGADLAALVKEAAMHTLRRLLPDISGLKADEQIPKGVLEKLRVTKEDFDYALRMVQPSAMREVLIEIPKVKWSDVGGLEEVKQSLKEAVEWPLKYKDSFKRLGVKPPRGILLYGPPGCGKTYIAKALANEAGTNFISIKGPEVFSKWVGESEQRIRDTFRRAKQVAPSIIFFDEIDSIVPRRGLEAGTRVTEQVVSQILTEMSGIEEMEGVVVVAATNRPDIMDPALLRPGRFDRLIYVPSPDEKTRVEILKVHTKSMPLKGVNLEKLSGDLDGYSGADIEAVVREAALEAMRENINAKEITTKHFEHSLKKIKPSITEGLVKKYQKAAEEMKKTGMDEIRYIG